MSQFQIGDVVQLRHSGLFGLQAGQVGQIIGSFDERAYIVSFFNWHDGHDGVYGDCAGVNDGSAAFINEMSLTLVLSSDNCSDFDIDVNGIL